MAVQESEYRDQSRSEELRAPQIVHILTYSILYIRFMHSMIHDDLASVRSTALLYGNLANTTLAVGPINLGHHHAARAHTYLGVYIGLIHLLYMQRPCFNVALLLT